MTTPAATRLAYLAAARNLVHLTTSDKPPGREPMASRVQGDPAPAEANGPKACEFLRLHRIGARQRVPRE
jgi:hypothetical protein